MSGLLRPGPRRWRGVAMILPFVVLVIGAILYTNHVQRVADHRWCAFITTLDEWAESTPPQTEVGRRFAVDVQQLREDLDC